MSELDRALDAYLAVIARDGWAGATLAAVAAEAGLSPAAVLVTAGNQWQALDRAADRADRAALAAAQPDIGASAREQLFDLIMARFDAVRPLREAGRRLLADSRLRPALALALLALAGRTAARLLSAADIGTTGLAGLARVQGLAVILADIAPRFLEDNDPDLGATMRALDERLEKAEHWVDRLRLGHRSPAPAPDPDAAAAL